MKKRIFALGFFDGVHLGHQALLRECCDLATQMGCGTAATTFAVHPLKQLTGQAPHLLSTVEDRVALLRQYGMEEVHILAGDEATLSMPWEAFLESMILEQGAVGFVCGDDFRFGAGGEGNSARLLDYCKHRNLPCRLVGEQKRGEIRISSTYIRSLLDDGRMGEAVDFLGHPHRLSGIVERGKQLGRTIGIPTANLSIPDNIVCPRFGVYACQVLVDNHSYMAVVNVGTRPTVGGEGIAVESWLLNFDGDLYGKIITVAFRKFLRPEKKFDSLEDLKAEIQKNAVETREFFEKSENNSLLLGNLMV